MNFRVLACFVFFLVTSNQVLSQCNNDYDTIFVDSTLNEITTIMFTKTGYGGGRGGGAARNRMISFTVKDTLNVVQHTGFLYTTLDGCIPNFRNSIIYSYNVDGSFHVTTEEQKLFHTKRRSEHYGKSRRKPKTKYRKELRERESLIFRKISFLTGH